MDKKDSLLIVLITAPDLDTAQALARSLLSKGIAACVNISPGLLSLYRWEGELQEDQEVLLLIKTRESLLESQLIPLVEKLHPYELPEIIALPIVRGSGPYLEWLREETSRSGG